MTLRRHCISILAAACILATPTVLAQEPEDEAMGHAPALKPFTQNDAKEFVKKVAAALDADANAEPPKEGERRQRPQAYSVLARNPYIARGLANNRHMPQEVADMMVGEFEKFKEAYPTQAELLDKAIFAVSNLTIGREAPNIKGVDTDEVEFKLSDYRGKVVAIDFWGDW